MTWRFPDLAIVLTTILLTLGALTHEVSSQDTKGKSLRILVDASKDGGLWWFPQAGIFSAEEHHQGRAFAANMKDRGWAVAELGRGHEITHETINGFDVVIIVQPFFPYKESELQAYVTAVENGARLLLLGADRGRGVHAAFGLRSPFPSKFGSPESWLSHPLTNQIENVEVIWTPVVSERTEAIPFAQMGVGGGSPSIMTYLPFGSGAVVYIGHSAVMSPTAPMLEHLLDAIETLGSRSIGTDGLKRVKTQAKTGIPAPTLTFPLGTDSLAQPADEPWRFDWEDVPGAVGYELVVSGPTAAIPWIRARTNASDFLPDPHPVVIAPSGEKRPFIADHNLRNWTWRVRARGVDGVWGAWSKAGRFNVRPVRQ